jgi:hypothetical protein
MFRKSLQYAIALTFLSSQAFAQSRAYLSNSMSDEMYRNKISEFFYNKTGAEILKPVKLLGQVNRPGIYHIPENTTLTTLLALAGGTERGADLNDVQISNPDHTNSKISVNDYMKNGKDQALKANDIVFVPEKKYMFDPDTTNTVMVSATIITVLLSIYVTFKPKSNGF